MAQVKTFYIVSTKYSKGSDIVLWRRNACGYTSVLELAGIYTAEQIAKDPAYFDNGFNSIAVPCKEIEAKCVRVIGNTDASEFIYLARKRGLKDGVPTNGFNDNPEAKRCTEIHNNGERCTRVHQHGVGSQRNLGLFHITPSDHVWYTAGIF
jgi:hypothetical protein